jgi:hypothetical protein
MKHQVPKLPPDPESIRSLPLTSCFQGLTPAQLEFARLLGRLLAEKWDREREQATPSAHTPLQ